MKLYSKSAASGLAPMLTVVAPVFNEADGIEPFCAAVAEQLEKLTDQWEMILVNDGSTDGTAEILRKLHQQDARIKVVQFARNFGNQIAASAGLKYAGGQAVITMDSDLQHPPELIPEMVRLWKQEHYHLVYTLRKYDKKSGFIKRSLSSLFGKTLNYCSHLSMPDGLSDYRLLDRRVVNAVNTMGESSRFLRAMIDELGFRKTGIAFEANHRIAGTTKFSFLKLLKLAVDGITSFSVAPLRWITYSGLSIAAVSILYACKILLEVFTTGVITPGFPTLIVAILFLGGMQLTALGIVGEYIGRIYMETKHRPLFVVQEQLGWESETEKDASLVRAA